VSNLHLDPARKGQFGETGIFVRALDGTAWVSTDIADLDRESLIEWLQSGANNTRAENVVAMLLGHGVQT